MTDLQSIRGRVVDQSNLPLVGATVQIVDSDPVIGAVTDEDGRFVLTNVEVGRHDLLISYIGYNTFRQNSVYVSSAEETILEIQLEEQKFEMGEIVITSDERKVVNEAALVSSISFQVEELSRVPGGVDDPARMLRKFPGVSPSPEIYANNINIRGNAGRAVLWRMEDIDIYNPSHFAIFGGSSGSVTIFSQQLLTSTDFYAGAFPADYGNALGGFFDVRFKNGNSQKREHSAQLSLLGLDVSTEGPINRSNNSSYIANYRYSTTGLINNFIDFDAIPTYQDVSFKLHFNTKSEGSINIFGVGGTSSVNFKPSLDTAKWKEDQYSNFGSETVNYTGTLGASFIQPVNQNTYFKSVVVGTGMKINIASYYLKPDLVEKDTSLISDDIDYKISWHNYINHKFSDRHTHRSGIILHGLASDVSYVNTLGNTELQGIFLTDTIRYGIGSSLLAQAYTRSQFYLNEKWQFNVGLHAMYLNISKEFVLEPRLGIRYALSPKQSLNFAYGLHSQMDPFFTYITESFDPVSQQYVRKNKDLQFNKAHHITLAYYWQILEKLKFGVEIYYQSLYDIVVRTDYPISRVGGYDFSFESSPLNNGGTGQNYGIEIALERSFSNGYFWMFNTSIFESNYTANDMVRRKAQFSTSPIINAVAGKEWQFGKKSNKLNFLNLNFSFTYSGAQYVSTIDLEQSIKQGYFSPDYANPNSFRQDDLLFLDASIIFKQNRKKYNTQFTIQISNILNRRPLMRPFFDRNTQSLKYRYGTGVFPIMAYRISF